MFETFPVLTTKTNNCKNCDRSFTKKTHHHKFCSLQCKDKFHNNENPRMYGKFKGKRKKNV